MIGRCGQLVDRLAQLAALPPNRLGEGPAGVGQHRGGVGDGLLGQVGQLTGQPQHGSLRLFLGLRGAQLQLRPDRVHLRGRRLAAVPEPGAGGPAGDQLAEVRAGPRAAVDLIGGVIALLPYAIWGLTAIRTEDHAGTLRR